MKYDVRYLIGGTEQTAVVDAETAAEAVHLVQTDALAENTDASFELIQLNVIDESEDHTADDETPDDASHA